MLSDCRKRIKHLRDVLPKASPVGIGQIVVTDIINSPEFTEDVYADFGALLATLEGFKSISDYLAAFATDREQFSQFYESDYVECPVPTSEGYLTISTIHSAKGLEWKNVYIMGLCEGNFPNPYFCKGKTSSEEQDFFNGEWKKMYVASTRAQESLHLTYSSSITRKGYTFNKAPSRFINNIKS